MTLEVRLRIYEYAAGSAAEAVIDTYEISSQAQIVEYLPSRAPVETQWTRGPLPGAWPVGHEVRNVRDRLRLSVPHGGAYADALDVAGDITKYLERARWSAELSPHERRVMLEMRDTDFYSTWHGTRVYGGVVRLQRGIYMEMEVDHAPYWDSTTEETLRVESQATAGYQSVAPIRDRDDATASNWVLVESPLGKMPTPLIISVEDKSLATLPDNLGQVRMGWDMTRYSCVLEAENSLLPKTTTSNAAYSNNAYATAVSFLWTVNVSYLGPYRILVLGSLSGTEWYATLGFDNEVYRGESTAGFAGGWGWTDLGLVMLPPGGAIHPSRRPFYLRIDGTVSSDVDFVILMPARQYRRLAFQNARAATTLTAVDDGWRREMAIVTSSGREPTIDGYGLPIYAWPNGLLPTHGQNTIHFTLEDFNGVTGGLRAAEVSVKYRRRHPMVP